MTKLEQLPEDVIDLGTASVETKGGHVGVLDNLNSLEIFGGISDD